MKLESVNGSPVIEYRDIDGHPAPYIVTIQRRQLDPDGEEYLDGSSQWQTVTIGDVLDQLRLGGPVAEWVRNQTRVDYLPTRFLQYARLSDPAYLWNRNA